MARLAGCRPAPRRLSELEPQTRIGRDAGVVEGEHKRGDGTTVHLFIAWFTWATAMLNHRWTAPEEVPSDLPLPAWDWEGTEGW